MLISVRIQPFALHACHTEGRKVKIITRYIKKEEFWTDIIKSAFLLYTVPVKQIPC
jgi:hypothetical protein